MKHMLDLYSGLGGASEAFVEHEDWNVLRIDNNHLLMEVPHTVIRDIRTIDVQPSSDGVIDFVWASPPCREFSLAYAAPKAVAKRNGERFVPDLSLLEKALEIIEILQPRYWMIENVIGAIKDFKPILGEPSMIIGPFALWGNVPKFTMPPDFNHKKSDQDTWSTDPLRANKKGKIPRELSQKILEVIDNQKTMFEFQSNKNR